jgi:GT2 family glycosyltransferase
MHLTKYKNIPSVVIVRNEINLGYTKTVNLGIHLAGTDDIVLLNSDTIVTPNWLFGLRLAGYSKDDVGTVTAMSDNAGAFSFPVPGRPNPKPKNISFYDYGRRIIKGCLDVPLVELPTGNGFCMYIRRALIDAIGTFDQNAFPRGYGEENDYCMRAIKSGFLNLLTPWSFVFHVRTASFKGEKEKLAAQGLATLNKLHPDYEKRVKHAFSSSHFLHLATAAKVARNLIEPQNM